MLKRQYHIFCSVLVILVALLANASWAEPVTSESYSIPFNFFSTFGASKESASFSLSDIGGQSTPIGSSDSTSYQLNGGSIFGIEETLRVWNSTQGIGYTTIQAALSDPALAPGDVITIEAGIFNEHDILWPNVSNIILSGEGSGLTTIDAQSLGRAIYVGSAENLTIEGITITGANTSSSGGGIYLASSSLLWLDTVTVKDCTAAGNGGAIYADGVTVNVINSTFSGNHAGNDGGVGFGGTWTVTNCAFSSNFAGSEGAIANGGSWTVSNSSFIGNIANWRSGIARSSTWIVSNSTFSGNNGGSDGGIVAYSTWTMTNCIFNGNSCTNLGGVACESACTVTNCTFSGNIAGNGGIGYGSDWTIINSIFAGGSSAKFSGMSGTAKYSDVDTGDWGGMTATNCISVNPQFISSNNFYLLSTSNCIDTGTFEGAPAFDISGLVSRPQPSIDSYANFDMGVYEQVASISRVWNATQGLGYATIQAALSDPALNPNDLITMEAGIFNEHDIVWPNVDNITLRGVSYHDTIISADALGRVFGISSSVNLTIEGVTLKNGNDLGNNGAGIIFNNINTKLWMKDCMVESCNSSAWGGAFYVADASNDLFLTNCIIKDNSAWAGGVAYRGIVHANSCTFYGNFASVYADIGYECDWNSINSIYWGGTSPANLFGHEEHPSMTTLITIEFCDIQPDKFVNGTGNISSEPLFISTTFGDADFLKPLPTSETIDSGTFEGASLMDITGVTSRPQPPTDPYLNFDMGVYEQVRQFVYRVWNSTQGIGYTTIQDALSDPGLASGDVITTEAGIYNEHNILWPNVENITLRGAGMDVTTIDAGNLDLAVTLEAPVNLSIEALTVTRGFLNYEGYPAGGGIYLLSGSNLDLTNVTIMNCAVDGTYPSGGAIWSGSSNVYAKDCLFHDNYAGMQGGVADGGNWTAVNCKFYNNVANQGAVISVVNMNFINCLVYNNNTRWESGGVAFSGNSTAINSVFYNNRASRSGGVAVYGIWNSKNSIYWANTAVDSGPIFLGETVTSNYDDLQLDGFIPDTGNISKDPMFISTSFTDPDFARPSEGSPCIDAASIEAPSFDMIGNFRPNGLGNDIGAYEFQGPSIKVVSPNGGESILVPSTYNLTYEISPDASVVRIWLSTNEGLSWDTLITDEVWTHTAGVATLEWTPTKDLISSQCLISIEVTDGILWNYDVSDAVFEISEPRFPIVYISPSGSDEGEGTLADPFATLQRGLNRVSAEGYVYAMSGVYTGEANYNVVWPNRNNISLVISLDATGPVTFDAQGMGRFVSVGAGIDLTINDISIVNGYIVGIGGAIYLDQSTIHLQNVIIEYCTAEGSGSDGYGGAIGSYYATVEASDSRFTNNTASQGGGVIYHGMSLTATNCVIENNSVTGSYASGSVIQSLHMNGIHIYDSTIVNNVSNGGGVFASCYSDNNIFINTIFANNVALSGNGGVFSYVKSPTITNCTFYGNTADNGGVSEMIYGTINITNTIFYNNIGNVSAPLFNNTSGTMNIIYSDVQPNGFVAGTGNISTDPRFVSTTYGTTGFLSLDAGSPAIDTASIVAPAFDLAGNSRPHGLGNDMGVYEFQGPSISVESPNGGESYKVGDPISISWIASDEFGFSPDQVNISYSYDNGANWTFIASPAMNSSPYIWSDPSLLPGAGYLISIEATNSIALSNYDTSNNTFSIGIPVVYISPNGDDTTGDGSINLPYKTLQKGLNIVAASGEVRAMPGVFTIEASAYTKTLEGFTCNTMAMWPNKTDITLIGTFDALGNSAPVTFDAESNGRFISLMIGNGLRMSIKDVTVMNGHAIFDGVNGAVGGAFYLYPQNVTLSIKDVICVSNTADSVGGVVASIFSGNNIFAENSQFIENTAFYGGGVALQGTWTVTNCAFVGNGATNPSNSSGGVGYSSGIWRAYNCLFKDNFALIRGGVFNSVMVSATGCTFEGNWAPSGAIFTDNGEFNVLNCIFNNNRATTGSGSIAYQAGTLTATNCVFANNSAAQNGFSNYANNVNLNNCTVYGNTAETYGISNYGTYNLVNTIIWGNSATSSNNSFGPSVTVNSTYSDIQPDGFVAGTGNISVEPKFASILISDPNYLLLSAGSPCIDTASIVAPAFDLAGNSRPHGLGNDMGVFEFQGQSILVVQPNGGESIIAETLYTITYDFTPDASEVRVRLSTNEGLSWDTLITDEVWTHTAGTGTIDWTPSLDMISNNCLVSIEVFDGVNWNFDTSNALFEIITPPPPIVYISPNGDDTTGDGSVILPYKTLQKGLNIVAVSGEVRVMPGVYTQEASEYVNYAGPTMALWPNKTDISIRATFEADGTTGLATVDSQNYGRFFFIENSHSNISLTIEGIGFVNGLGATAPAGFMYIGADNVTARFNNINVTATSENVAGAIYCQNDTVNVYCDNSTFKDCDSYYPGGVGAYGTWHLKDSLFVGNNSYQGGVGYSGVWTVEDCTFLNNTANTSGSGGSVGNYGVWNIKNSTFEGNTSAVQAGVFGSIYGTITNCAFSNNTATIGGVFANQNNLSVYGSKFIGNHATELGGVSAQSSTTYFYDCLFENNWSDNTGSVIDSTSIYATNSLFINNRAQSYTFHSSSFYFTNCVIYGNTAESYSVAGDCSIGGYNNIVFANTATDATPPFNGSVGWTFTFSDIQADGLLSGPSNITSDPMFVDPSSGDYHLAAGSPNIDRGTDASAYTTNDYDGNIRPKGLGWDAGAYEFQGPSVRVTYPNGGESLTIGDPVTITWETMGTIQDNVNIRYSNDGGASWNLIAGSITNSLSYSGWDTSVLTPGMYLISVEVEDMDNVRGFDASDSAFTIGISTVYVSPEGSDTTGDGTHANPFRTIQYGLSVVSEGGKVILIPGVYSTTEAEENLITWPNKNDITLMHSDISLWPADTDSATIDATYLGGSGRLIYVDYPVNISIEGITLKNGDAQALTLRRGGAIFLAGGTVLDLTSCIFDSNKAGEQAGAINCVDSIVKAVNCTFISNEATGMGGGGWGGVFDGFNGSANSATIIASGCAFYGNSAASDAGVVSDFIRFTVNDCVFIGNYAKNYSSAGVAGWGATFEAVNCTFEANTAENNGGVAYLIDTVSFTNSNFVNNYGSNGGGIVDQIGSFNILGCTFTSNRSDNYGGVAYDTDTVIATNCTFISNESSYSGGVFDSILDGTVSDCAFTSNAAYNGGVIGNGNYVTSNWTVWDSVFNGNEGWSIGGVSDHVDMDISGGIFIGNKASDYGGVFNEGTLVINGVIFIGNETTYRNGGVMSGGNMTLNGCNFIGNKSAYYGGVTYYTTVIASGCSYVSNEAIYQGGVDIFGTYSVDHCIFFGNKSGQGGVFAATNLTGQRSTFVGNVAENEGGVGYFNSSNILNNCIFESNTATKGGVFYISYGDLVSTNCAYANNNSDYGAVANGMSYWTSINDIFWGNIANISGEVFADTNPLLKYSDIQSGGLTVGIDTGTGGTVTTLECLSVDPNFLSTTFGDVNFLKPDQSNQTINAGTFEGSPATDITGLVTRPQAPDPYLYFDMGVYEQEKAHTPILTVYISPEGSNLSGDGSLLNPYRTLQKGLDQIDPGGSVMAIPGEYNETGDYNVIWPDKNNITLRLSPEATEPATFDAQTLGSIISLETAVSLSIESVSFINSYLDNQSGGAITLQPGSDLTLDKVTMTNNSFGSGGYWGHVIYADGANVTIKNSVIKDNPNGQSSIFGGTFHISDSYLSSLNGRFISNSTVYLSGCTFEGITTESRSSFANNCTIYAENSTFKHGRDWLGPVVISGTLVATNCAFFDNIAGNDGMISWMSDNYIYNCTIAYNSSNYGVCSSGTTWYGQNNIIYYNHTNNYPFFFNMTSVSNMYSDIQPDASLTGTGNISIAPRFITTDEASPDFLKLDMGSPAIDSASIEAPAYDIAGNVRPYGLASDMGIYEFQGPSVRVIQPNGGEIVAAEVAYGITYNVSPDVSEIIIRVSTDEGLSWNVITDEAWAHMAGVGTFEWIPDVSQISTECLVSVEVFDGVNWNYDTSDATFEVIAPIYRVWNSTHNKGYVSITAALSDTGTLTDGDLITAEAGVFNEHDITWPNVDNVTLSGEGSGLTTIDAQTLGRSIYLGSTVNLTIESISFINGSTSGVGGAFIYLQPGSLVTLNNINVSGCNATSASGGAIFAQSANVRAINSTFRGCGALGIQGGGVMFGGTLEAQNSKFISNVAYAGGMFAYVDANIVNCILYSNVGHDGAISDGGKINAINCTFDQMTGEIGGISSGTIWTGSNNIFWNNIANISGPGFVGGSVDLTYCVMQPNSFVAGTGNVSVEPMFLSTSEASSDFLKLGGNSPCVDSADLTGAPTMDIDGNLRPHGFGNDMGAYEYQGPSIRVIQPNGGEIISAGSTYSVTYNMAPDVSEVRIWGSTNGGLSWDTLLTDEAWLHTFGVTTYEWTPDVSLISTDCLVSVEVFDGVNWNYDTSDATFEISALTLLPIVYISPNGSDSMGDGSVLDPYATLQKGLDMVADSGVINAMPGTTGVFSGAGNYNVIWPDKNNITLMLSPEATGPVTFDAQSMGRVIVVNGAVNLTIESITITNGNGGTQGGGLWLADGSVVSLKDDNFLNNNGQYGGAIYAGPAGISITTVEASGCIFKDNTSGSGGAAFYGGHWTVRDCTFEGNTAGSGGVYAWTSSVSAYNSSFVNNHAIGIGGVGRACALYAEACYFSGNSAVNAGGVTDIGLIAVNSVFLNNSAGNYEGVVAAGYMNVTNCSFYGNTSGMGGIFGEGPITAKNSIFWGGSADKFFSITSGSFEYCDVENGEWEGQPTVECITSDPKFISGSDLRLAFASPCIDTASIEAPLIDLAGNTRPYGFGNDMGAYEFQGPSIRVVQPNGGEILNAGDPYSVTWLTSGEVLNVNIWLSLDNGTSWTSVISQAVATGLVTYEWPVPATPSTECLISVEAFGNGLWNYDSSNATFEIRSTLVTIYNVCITRESDAIGGGVILSWNTTPDSAPVDIYSKTGDFNMIAAGWSVNSSGVISSGIDAAQLRNGINKWYKIIPAGVSLTNDSLTQDVVGKFDITVSPVTTAPEDFFISIPVAPCNGKDTVAEVIGLQADQFSQIHLFDMNYADVQAAVLMFDNKWRDADFNMSNMRILPGYAYGFVTENVRTISIVGSVLNENATREIFGSFAPNFIGTMFPAQYDLTVSGLNSSSYGGFGPDTCGTVYYFDGNLNQIKIAIHKSQGSWLDENYSASDLNLVPGKGYLFTEPIQSQFIWSQPRP